MNTGINDLSTAILDSIAEYSEEIDKTMQEEIDKISDDIVKSLKSNPIIPKRTGEYRKGFRVKKAVQGTGFKRNIIYNKKHQLTHLLENGHLKNNGMGRTKAFPHWKEAQKMSEKLPERIAERLENE